MIRIFEAQRLISLDTLFDLADNLESLTRGEKLNTGLVHEARGADHRNPVAARFAVERGKELAGVRLLDRAAHRAAAQD